jgi:hypothetical protein
VKSAKRSEANSVPNIFAPKKQVASSYSLILPKFNNHLQVDQGLPAISRDYFLNETLYSKQLSAYKKYFTNMVRLLISDAKETRSQKQIDQDVNDIIEFEKKFANVKYIYTRKNLRVVPWLNYIIIQLNS